MNRRFVCEKTNKMDGKQTGWMENKQNGGKTNKKDGKQTGWMENKQNGWKTNKMDGKQTNVRKTNNDLRLKKINFFPTSKKTIEMKKI